MSRYNQYGAFYDPVGSQTQQPSGYTYQSATPATTSSGYASNYQYGGNTYPSQQYSTTPDHQSNNSASRAAAALSSMSNPNYTQNPASSRADPPGHYEGAAWYNAPNPTSNSYPGNNSTGPNRAQSNNTAHHATNSQSSSAFGRLSLPETTQAASTSYGSNPSYLNSQSTNGAKSYQTAYGQPQSQQPPRYNSPLHATQAQQHSHPRQPPRTSNTHQPSPQMTPAVHQAQQSATNRQQSASAEPSPATVDPSQVYDNRAELQRKAAIDAEKRRKYDAEQAAQKAEEDRVASEKRKVEEEQLKAAADAAKKEKQAQKNEQRRKAREGKKAAESAPTTLQNATSAVSADASEASAVGEDEEAMMRAMFQKMREFNAKNPTMLAKLWEEERKNHAQAHAPSQQSAQASTATLSKPSPPAVSAAEQQLAGKNDPKTSKQSAPHVAKAAPHVAKQQPPPSVADSTTPAGGNTILWPPHKKRHIADVISRWLRTLPQNTGSSITSLSVLDILDRARSFVQLCEALEESGLIFVRTALATELVRANPDPSKTQPASKATVPVGGSGGRSSASSGPARARERADPSQPQSSPGTASYEAPLSSIDAAREVTSMGQAAISPPSAYGGPVQHPSASTYFAPRESALATGSRAPSQSQAPETKPDVKMEKPARPPANKEEAARKRTFGDLVDLTAEDSDDEEPLPKRFATPVVVADGADGQSRVHPNSVGTAGLKLYKYMPSPAYSMPAGPNGLGDAPPATQHQMASLPQPSVVPAHPKPPIVQPQIPLKPRGPTLEQQQHSRMKGKMLVEPIMRDRVAKKSKYDSKTIARDVLLATGRHPDMRGLNAHLAPMQKLLGQHGGDMGGSGAESVNGSERGNRSDLATIKWDLVDAEPPTETEDGVLGRKGAREAVGDSARSTSATRAAPVVEYEVPPHHSASSPSHKGNARRGRPPKHGPAKLTNATLGGAPTATSSSRPSTPSTHAPPNVNGNMPSGAPVGYAAFRQIADDGTVVKKKGRPVGWRKNLHSREAQGLTPKSSATSRLKQPKSSGLPPSDAPKQVEPQYQIYKCAWRGCAAELHNLATLTKHMIKVHGSKSEESGKYECWWKGCPVHQGGTAVPRTFDAIEPWVQHVDTEHVKAVAWELGDGPKADLSPLRYDSSSEPPAYLLDRDGRLVTPIISPGATRATRIANDAGMPQVTTARQLSTSTSPLPVPSPIPDIRPIGRGRPPKDGIPRWQREPGVAVIDAPLKELEEHKRLVGASMERTGCVLADDARRAGFLDDEDFEDEVEGSEYDDTADDEVEDKTTLNG